MDLEVFAAEREDELTELAKQYKPAVEDALEEEDEASRTAEFVLVLTVLFLLTYGDEGGEEDQSDFFLKLFLQSMEAVLPETTPAEEPEARTAQVSLISNWFATATLGAATMYAAESSGQPLTKTWVTMRDNSVRETHEPLDGEIRPIDGAFVVKTDPPASMQYPDQPVGPVEAWINCRCVLSIGGLLSSAFAEHELIWYENRRTPEVVAKGAPGKKGGAGTAAGKVVKRRAATEEEERTIARGDWVRVEPGGKKPSDPGYKKAKRSNIRPQHNESDTEVMAVTEEETDLLDPAVPDEPLDIEDENQPVYGVAVIEGSASGDGRMFSEGALTWRDLPLPLTWQRASGDAHGGSVVVGRMDRLERDGNLIRWSGELLTDVPETEEVISLIANEALRGVSVDVDSAEMSVDEEGSVEAMMDGRQPQVEFTKGRISGLTIVQIPAFAEAFISLGVDPKLSEELLAAAEVEVFKRGSGWITHPEETKTLHDYWTKGEGAAKIRWGTNGDFTRCTRQLRKYISPRFLNRTCAQWHHDVLGYWPGELGKPGNPVSRNSLENCNDCEETAMIAASASPELTLVAAAPPSVVPMSWFDNPGFDAATSLTVEKSGRVYGHIATWGTCHIGIDKVCVEPPKSRQGYAYFHLGTVLTDEGELAVGSITMNTGHADLSLSANDTKSHYDHTGSLVANVRAGEDAHGIWIAGSLADGVTADQRRILMASGGISGDWRLIGGALELVAALAVNVPGFPVPRPALAASGERQTSLVAAGVVTREADPEIDALAEAVVAKIEAKQKRQQKLQAIAPLAAEVKKRRVAKILGLAKKDPVNQQDPVQAEDVESN